MGVSIQQAADLLGVSISTLRRWEREGRISSERTAGGHRRYELAPIQSFLNNQPKAPEKRITLAYARVSSHDQKSDLKRQSQMLSQYCATHGWSHEIIEDLGSGLNYNKRGLRLLIKRICAGSVNRIVLTHKDRLLRFGSEIVFSLCEHFATEVVIINQSEDSSYEEDLTHDVLEIITVFSARLYGSRSHKNRDVMKALKEVADGL